MNLNLFILDKKIDIQERDLQDGFEFHPYLVAGRFFDSRCGGPYNTRVNRDNISLMVKSHLQRSPDQNGIE